MIFLSRPTLEEISREKQIKTKLRKCNYEQLCNISTYIPKKNNYNRNPFHPLNVINSILSPSSSGEEAAEEYKAQRVRNLAIEVIAEKYPNRKQPTKLEDYL